MSDFLAGLGCLIPIAIGIYGFYQSFKDVQEDMKRYRARQEEENQRREEIIRMGIAYNAWNHMRNHDGNPYNDSVGSAYTPGTDAWKAKHRF